MFRTLQSKRCLDYVLLFQGTKKYRVCRLIFNMENVEEKGLNSLA